MTATTFRKKAGSYWSYTLDGQPRMKGVTTLMKGLSGPPESYFCEYTAGFAVDNWERLSALPVAQRLKEISGATKARFQSAGVKGTAVHNLAEKLSHGEEVRIPDDLRGHVESAVQFLDDWEVEPIVTEAALFSRRHQYAGSADLFATGRNPLSGQRVRFLGDYKTSASGPWGSVAFQLAGYYFADFMLDGDAGKESAEVPIPECDEFLAIWIRGDGYDVYPMHVTREVHRELLYIDQCKQADDRCRDYKGDALPKPETVRKVRLEEVAE
jgi:hypothetical protein